MTKDDCFQLGNISRTHGNQGELSFWLDVDDPLVYQQLDSVLIDIDDALVPFFIQRISMGNKQLAYVKLEDVDTIDKAQQLVGYDLYLPMSRLPKLEGNKFYYHEIIGFQLIDASVGLVGTITDVYDLSNNPLISIDHEGTEILVPLADPFIDHIARDERRFYMNLPAGLIDIYLKD
ncbi:MAG TPA: 16S rRNA processing protein RimM [Bacteroidales bacterium]|nr:MAG: 16S rRNA processing protein RimM [Bacteroidetes bacterium GWE2_42_24]OFY27484.1 MAG: 16S rRNA processing protein RimM [Bacteroidetes bacterium GWF2_43_11]HAQ65123.1 16S rRNA processing protein RimM [Bacteroidales bacterium]HBZ66003.1 16S rRNA processing protein RimM [Bacteroidales bacterium]